MLEDKLGRQLRDLRISLTDRCNFRCEYCMPADGYGKDWKFTDHTNLLSDDEIVRLSSLGVQLGATRLRLTGGEPLLRKGMLKLVERLRNLTGISDLSLTTNGWFLESMADDLSRAGLSRITVSLDSLDEEIFRSIIGIGSGNGTKQGAVVRVLKGIEAAQAAGLDPVKVNMVIQGVNKDQIVAMAEQFRGSGVILRFIEYMDVGGCSGWQPQKVVEAAEILRLLNQRWALELIGRRDEKPASRHRYVDGQGEIGVVASISEPFCSSCTRARLSADGELFTCLFATKGLDLRTPLRRGASDEELLELIQETWQQRTDRYSEERKTLGDSADNIPATDLKKVEMHRIGG